MMLPLALTLTAALATQPWMDKSDPPAVRAKALLDKMTLVRTPRERSRPGHIPR